MIESQQVLEWMAMGEAKGEARGEKKGQIKGKAESLLRVLTRRFPPGATPEIVAAIQTIEDAARLESWLDLAVTTNSLDSFHQTAGL